MTVRALFYMGVNVLGGIYYYLKIIGHYSFSWQSKAAPFAIQ